MYIKPGYVLIGWQKCDQSLQEPNPVFPLETMTQYLLIQCPQQLYRT